MAINASPHGPNGAVYIPEVDLEDFEEYRTGGYHPTTIGDTFDNRYEVVHKLGFGGYSTIWLARDKHLQQYVSLKIMIADESSKSTEASILRKLRCGGSHPGRRFVPHLLDDFSFSGPNGHHVCLVQKPIAACNITASKEDSVSLMFPVETARSIAAQIIMGVSYLHSRGVCHGDLHMRNFLLYSQDFNQNLNSLDPEGLYKRYRLDKAPISRFDGTPVGPHAPPYAVYPMHVKTPADNVVDPMVGISDYGTSFVVATVKEALTEPHTPELHTPALYLPPEGFFNDLITQAADIWTLGVSLYEVLGERPLFESFGWDRDDIIAEMRMWDMGRGETPDTCQWDTQGGEMQALEELLRGMMAFEPTERLTAEQLMRSEYMEKWAMPAWERQQERQRESGSSNLSPSLSR
ncbi:kinase domain-containing protein [Colletotrichum navitas]|uniref:non-specific serine/threonine protein kinase n=1 Tax=Colletotrichum navitas TaxID=681940 RepID=A0AAD8V417_9PEZI|nr:kinase domain-containing protein [Colletotrichum navitas]KAK1589922.1 kinase domain-containing protein [Colletotrichum navitas]